MIPPPSHWKQVKAPDPEMRRKTIFVYYKVMGRDLPLTWHDAIARQERQDA